MSEELIVRHCAPTLAGIKTGNMFSCDFATKAQMCREIRQLNCTLSPKGICVLPLKYSKNRALVYVYRPKSLEKDLNDTNARELLQQRGYVCGSAQKCVLQVVKRLEASAEFPHEIGLFLGYPPEDVRGFIENKAACSKCIGCWKVYGDEQKAKKLFSKYQKCTSVYEKLFIQGKTIEGLTVKS